MSAVRGIARKTGDARTASEKAVMSAGATRGIARTETPRERLAARGYCMGSAERVPVPGEVDVNKRGACSKCGKRVAITTGGRFSRHKPENRVIHALIVQRDDSIAHAFLVGFAAALATLVRAHDRPTIARDIAVSNGLSLRDFKRAGVEAFDLSQIRKAFR